MNFEPPSVRAESVAVLRAGAFVFFGAWLVIGLHAAPSASEGETRLADLLPFQKLFRDEPATEQRMFRAISEGVLEAERTRSSKKSWPDVAALAGDGIPPFAPDPIEKTGLHWSFARTGLVANYRGVPSAAGAPEWLLLIQEPEPGTIDQAAQSGVVDETHHKLSDGTLLHVTIWMRAPAKADGEAVVERPFSEGWTQVLAGKS